MRKLAGLTVFLLCLYIALWRAVPPEGLMLNNYNLAERIGQYGIISLGAGIVIIAGGIDLSIGSVAVLAATGTAMLLGNPAYGGNPVLVLALVLAAGAFLGLIHGLFITKINLPAFMVTLCGLFIYRGVARTISGNMSKGLQNQFADLRHCLYDGDIFGLPRFLVIFLILAGVASVFLHLSVYGRYLQAIGGNEKAARYSGISIDAYKILTYVICSIAAALFGILFLMKNDAVTPSSDGFFLELYAIAGAVLGGCSLRGGEGTVAGIIIGTAIMWILPNLTNMWGIPSELEFIVIGGALLLGAILDEKLRPKGAAA
ncbi:MAG: sugar ABC transporter permease [Candidatus Melainabacteria bacterium]|nr:MAG: sugar ABC transporter permease [Candidatus Melainabacteria bacterium]